ncbi:hypothetical protein JKP88DRAFT_163559 [Tribonema minus]|uniref:Uncharacterized protein n=1 Tax=Tribonema minus TaxID=303371 RepID=A0A835YZ73_9STRA|nr:hypothetical protein JKP88DRAFT_163559 [Tribonema minus]
MSPSPQLFSTQNRYIALWMMLDIECTSLDYTSPDFGILEIAASVVDDAMEVIDTFHVIVHQNARIIGNSSRWCKQRFRSRLEGGNDLFAQCELSTITEEMAGAMLEEFILKHAKKRQPAAGSEHDAQKRNLFRAAEFEPIDALVAHEVVDGPAEEVAPPKQQMKVESTGMEHYRIMLAGCSVYFDRAVLLHRYPRLRMYIGHKTIELSSLLEIVRRWRPDLLRSLPPTQECHRALVDVMEAVSLLRWFWRSFLVSV